MDLAASKADIESLSGRPGAFVRVATGLLRAHAELRTGEWLDARIWGALRRDEPSRTVWWVWPWASAHGREPWSCPDTRELQQLHRWLAALGREPTLRMVVPRMPTDASAWTQQLQTWLRSATPRLEPRVHIDGPAELSRCAERPGHVAELALLHPRWILDAPTPALFEGRSRDDLSACERELIAALAQARATPEHWLVVADELQQRGDATGESLALALAAKPERPSRERELSRAYLDRESRRMARAPRHLRMLAFVGMRGSTAAIDEFTLGEAARYAQGFSVQLWAERVGPFFVRALVRTDEPEWQGIGLPPEVFEAPELRYLAAARLSVINRDASCICGRDLSGYVLTSLMPSPEPVLAYEASLRGCDLRGADLSSWQLDGADLRGATADVHTNFGEASFVGARVSPDLQRLLTSWNAGRHRPQRGRARGTADVRGLVVEAQSVD